MNIKTINQLETTNVVSGTYAICSDEEGNAKKYELPSLMKGDAENSVVLGENNNQVISENSVAFGQDNFVGLRGFYYKNVKSAVNPKLYNIYVTKTQTTPQLDVTDIEVERDIDLTQYYEVGDILTIINDTKYENCCKLRSFLSVNGLGTIQIELITDRNPFKDGIANMTEPGDMGIEDFSIYCVNKPLNGISVLSHSCFAGGHNNIASSTGSFAWGKNNNAFGKFSFAVGRDNEAAYSAYAEGRNNKALRDNAHAEGRNTIATAIEAHAEGKNTAANGTQSHAEGLYTIANGQASHAEGAYTITNNRAEHACGTFNKSTQSSDKSQTTQFSVGIGTSDTNRKNGLEVRANGDIYIYIGETQYKLQDILTGAVTISTDTEN